jgi:CheY-like chemotaxis protein
MDIQMPVMDGYTAAREIRNLESKIRNIPIIAMTAHAMAGDQEKSLAAGMNDHVTKPIDPEQLFATLRRWIVARKATGEPQVSEAELPKPGAPSVSTSNRPAHEEEFPDTLPGFDLSEGLNRLQGNRKLYKKLLLNFVSQYSAAPDSIRQAIDSKDYDQAHSLVHSLKGVAGNLAAKDLQAATVALEKLVKHVDANAPPASNELDNKLANMKEVLNQAVIAVEKLKPPVELHTTAASEPKAMELPPDLAAEAAQRLREAAEMGAVTKLAELATELKSTSNAFVPYADKIVQLADDFDFDGILELAAELESSGAKSSS